jgi:hypothetical protein
MVLVETFQWMPFVIVPDDNTNNRFQPLNETAKHLVTPRSTYVPFTISEYQKYCFRDFPFYIFGLPDFLFPILGFLAIHYLSFPT